MIFPWHWAAQTSYFMTTNFQLCSNISQILMLYKTWGHYNKFVSIKSLRVYYWYIKIPQCRCTEYMGFEDVAFYVNTLRPRQNGRHFPDDSFKWIFLNENIWISIEVSLKFVPKGPINNIPALVQIMAWRRPGDKPLSEPMMVSLLTHICVTRPQWVKKHIAP